MTQGPARTFGLSPHGIGVLLVIVSATVFSTGGLFTKGVSADAWSIIFWRGLFAGGFTLLYLALKGRLGRELATMGPSGWAVALIGASGSAVYIPALKITTIANATLIYATVPLLAAALAWMWIGERMSRRVTLSCLAAFCGVFVIVQGSLGKPHLIGDLLTLWVTLVMAIIMVIYRRYPLTPAAAPAVVMSFVLLPPALLFGAPFEAELHEIPIMAAFGLTFAVAAVTLAEGSRRVPSAEAGLLSAMETPLAPIWAWLLLAEIPASAPFVGGAVVMAAVVVSQLPTRIRRSSFKDSKGALEPCPQPRD